MSVGSLDVYINDQAGFNALGDVTAAPDPTNGAGTTYANGVSVSSSYPLSLTAGAAFVVSGSGTRVDPPSGITDGTVSITDASPSFGLSFNIIDVFDHGGVGDFEDVITISANGTPLFTMSDGNAIAASATGSVDIRAIDGTLITTITQGQATSTFIGVVNNAGTVSSLGIAYDYNQAAGSTATATDFHGIDDFSELSRAIDAIDDTPADVDSTTGATIPNVVANDTLGGVLNPTIGTDVTVNETGTAQDGTTVLGLDVTPAAGGITLNPANGEITVDPGTTPGTYVYTYEICEVGNPTNCDTATVTIEVLATAIVANDDTPASVDGSAGATIPNVVTNDTLGGVLNPAIGTDVTVNEAGTAQDGTTALGLDVIPAAGGITLNPANGEVTVDPGTTPGTYVYTYEICEVGNPTNCDTAEVTIVVDATSIVANDDGPVDVDGTTGASIPNVVANDTLGGVANPTIGTDVTVNETGTAQDGTTALGLDVTPAAGGITLNPANGVVTVAPGTTPGNYVYTYEICEVGNPTNCDTAEVTILVDPTSIVANDDTPPAAQGGVGATIPNVVANDTLGGVANPTIGTDVTVNEAGTAQDGTTALGLDVTPATGGITLNPANGEVTVAPGTTPGTFVYTYEICEVGNPINCDTAEVTIVVDQTEIIANDDTPPTIDETTGGTIPNVVTNDTLGGVANPAIGTDVTINTTGTAQDGTTALGLNVTPPAGGITLDPGTGVVTVLAGTTAGIYALTYEICEVGNPTNCDTAVVTVLVGTGGLIDEIEEDLKDILEEDLANTLATQSRQMSRFSGDAVDRLQRRARDACLAGVNSRLAQEKILFDTDKAIIKPQSSQLLDEIATILRSCSGSAFELAGHTDSNASAEYNQDLSQRRVTAVLRALTERGIDTAGFVARGYGEAQPIATNATAVGREQNRRVEFRALEDAEAYIAPCNDDTNLVRSFNADGSDGFFTADGQFVNDQHNCLADRREIFEGSLNYTDTDEGQTQYSVNLSYRREQYRGTQSVFGYFIGLYASQTDVSSRATGDIDGLGVNAGIYGANRIQNNLFVDYYLGAATGRHEFDLDFQRPIGVISASGDYRYVAGFAGAALSGEWDLGRTTVTPRAGFDYVFAPSSDVDVLAQSGALSEAGDLDLAAISGGRAFAELRTERLIEDGTVNVWLTPRISCYESLGGLDGACGFGGSIGAESVNENNRLSYSVELDAEIGDDFATGSLTMGVERAVGRGVLSGNAGLGTSGSIAARFGYNLDF
ncbi:OmpA family protein [Roseovarius rhodophyticola]|uniref:OmpA family protein n=1 Tax=Roseovarius rhodophyticola TaxID=3080827 RepID=A0ABZ2TG53_9RHOB|nr:OmpA family protein [Roseovarius sp. W115]MDV2928988.1 OmpA family protein [Roseovarius sp. W115]